MTEEDAERIKWRRWAIEQLAQTAPLDTTADLAQLCRAADTLIAFVQTGQHPRLRDGNGRGTAESAPESGPDGGPSRQ